MWRVLALLLLLLDTPAEAVPTDGGGASVACGQFVNGSTPGDTICPSTPSRVINDQHYGLWQFSSTSCAAGANTLAQHDSLSFSCALKFRFCNLIGNEAKTGIDTIVFGTVAQPLYIVIYNYVGQTEFYNSVGMCAPLLGFFLDRVTAYNQAQDSIDHATPGDTLTWRGAPASQVALGGWQWQGTAGITKSLTINMLPNPSDGAPYISKPQGATSPPGQGPVLIEAANVTLNGGASGATLLGNLKVLNDATNPTIENMAITGGTKAASPWLSSCILTSAREGTVTLTNVLVYECGDNQGAGQNHNLYISTQGGRTNTDNTCYEISGLTSLNVEYAGWSVKLRPPCTGGRQGHVINSVIGCTANGDATGLGCNQNGAIDFPCGGNHKVEHSVVELGAGAFIYNDAGFFMVKYGEEIPLNGGANCPNLSSATNALVFDHDIFINDNSTVSGGFECLVLTSSGRSCPFLAGATCTITNSQIISNTPVNGIRMGLGSCTDGGGNVFRASRAAALAAGDPGWSNEATYIDPTTGVVHKCCSFPYLPPHL